MSFYSSRLDDIVQEYGRPFKPSLSSHQQNRRRTESKIAKPNHVLYSEEEQKKLNVLQLQSEKVRMELRVLEMNAAERQQQHLLTIEKAEAAKAEEKAACELSRAQEVIKQAESIKKSRIEEENRAAQLMLEREQCEKEKKLAEEKRRTLEAKNRSLELDLQMQSVKNWSLECAVCLSAQCRYAAVPCGHYSFCAECAWDFVDTKNDDNDRNSVSEDHLLTETYYRRCKNSCPLCRTKIEGLLRIFITLSSNSEQSESNQ